MIPFCCHRLAFHVDTHAIQCKYQSWSYCMFNVNSMEKDGKVRGQV